jgi:predicted nucleic acid-binding protein
MVRSFVLDASVAAAWCFADETTPGSDALRESLVERRAVVARLWHTETTNLLLTAERRQRIKPERCEELLELLASLPIETQDKSDRLRGPVLRLARTHRLSVYDAVYLDLAMGRGLALATLDVALQKAARAEGVLLIET